MNKHGINKELSAEFEVSKYQPVSDSRDIELAY